MKHLFLLLTLLFFAETAGAQDLRSWGIYGGFQLTQTDETGIHGSINFHWNEKHALGFGLAWVPRAARPPKDYDQYRPHYLFGSTDPPTDDYYLWTFSYSRYLPIDRAGTLRLRLQAGLSAGSHSQSTNYHLVYYPSSGGFLSWPSYTAYDYDYVSSPLYGVTFNPALEYAPGRGFGLTAGGLACLSNERFCLAAEFGILFGRVRSGAHRARPSDLR